MPGKPRWAGLLAASPVFEIVFQEIVHAIGKWSEFEIVRRWHTADFDVEVGKKSMKCERTPIIDCMFEIDV